MPDTTAEAKVEAALFIIDNADTWFPEIATEVKRMLPSVLTMALGHPVNPNLLPELHEAIEKRDKGEDRPEIALYAHRVASLMDRIVRGPALVSVRHG